MIIVTVVREERPNQVSLSSAAEGECQCHFCATIQRADSPESWRYDLEETLRNADKSRTDK